VTQRIFQGKAAFELKATHGLPLDQVFHEVLVKRKLTIDWVGFLKAARSNNRWDFQTLPDIELSLSDAGVDQETIQAILQRCKLWILSNPM